jgi:NADH:ubiquinone oxidoreductase subunit E
VESHSGKKNENLHPLHKNKNTFMKSPTFQKILLEFEPRKENFLPAVKKVNRIFGYIGQENVYRLARYFSFSPAEAFSAISFYDDIRFEPKSNLEIKICLSTPCELRGASAVLREVESFLRARADADKSAKLEIVTRSCQGRCQRGPVIIVNGNIYDEVKPHLVDEILAPYFAK